MLGGRDMERILREHISKPNLGFEFSEEQRGSAVLFTCRGAFSLGSYAELESMERATRKLASKRIVLDMRQVAHIDSTGIGTLAAILTNAMDAKGEVRLVPSSAVKLAVGLARLDSFLQSFDSLESALAQ